MLIICEPRFTIIDEKDNEELFLTINDIENEKNVHEEIVMILSNLFPKKVGNIKTLGNSVYGITLIDADNIDNEIQIFNEYNAKKNSFEIIYEGKTLNTTFQFYTFMDRNNYPANMLLTEEQIENLQKYASNLTGLNNLNNMMIASGDLTGVNFNGSTISNSNFYDSLLITTQFTDTTINNTNFEEADMRYAKFEVSTLKNVNLNKADLRYADFQGSTLTDVNLSGADLRYTNLANVTFAGNCQLSGAIFVNLSNVLQEIFEYPPNLFDNVLNTEVEIDEEQFNEEEVDETAFLNANEAIFSSANVNAGDINEEADDADNADNADDEYVNTKPPICADIINGFDINIQSYLEKNKANFSIQLPNSDKYECANLNDIKQFHIKTDKAGTKYFNYVYACNSDKPYYAFTEDNYIRTQPYIKIGSFNLLVEKPEWFPQSEFPIYRKFKLVKTGSKPAFVSETMLRHGEQGDADYISSEWHCNAGKMDTYKLEPIMEGGRKYKKKSNNKKTHKNIMNKKKKTHKKVLHKIPMHKNKTHKIPMHKKKKTHKKLLDKNKNKNKNKKIHKL